MFYVVTTNKKKKKNTGAHGFAKAQTLTLA